MSDEMKQKMMNLITLKKRVRSLCDKYEQDLMMYVVEDIDIRKSDNGYPNKALHNNISLMRAVEQKVLKKVIADLTDVLNV